MRYAKCVVKRCQVTGEFGLVLESHLEWYYKNDNYIAGIRVAHELFDHFLPNQNGSIEHELFAIGSYMYRTDFYRHFENRYYHTTKSPESMLNGDLLSTISDSSDGFTLDSCPLVSKRVNPKIMSMMKNTWASENFIESVINEIGEYSEAIRNSIVNNFDNAVHWISYGYRMAKRRYNKWDSYHLMRIQETINKTAECLNLEYENQKFTLHYDMESLFAEFKDKGFDW